MKAAMEQPFAAHRCPLSRGSTCPTVCLLNLLGLPPHPGFCSCLPACLLAASPYPVLAYLHAIAIAFLITQFSVS